MQTNAYLCNCVCLPHLDIKSTILLTRHLPEKNTYFHVLFIEFINIPQHERNHIKGLERAWPSKIPPVIFIPFAPLISCFHILAPYFRKLIPLPPLSTVSNSFSLSLYFLSIYMNQENINTDVGLLSISFCTNYEIIKCCEFLICF